MPLTTYQSIITLGIIALITLALRVIPFLLFPENKKTPKYVLYLGKVLPHTITGMLVIYCLKDITLLSYPYGLPEILSIALIIILHIWKRSTLLSIGAGTLVYMFLLQNIFI